MLEVRDELLDRLDDLCLGEVLIGKDGLELVKEAVDFVHAVADGLLDDAQGLEAVHVELLPGNVELFVGLLAGGVALEIDNGIIGSILFHLGGEMLRFCIRGTFFLAEAFGLDEVVADATESKHLVFAELREEHFARIAEDAGEHADLAGFLRTHEVALDIAGSGQRLTLLKPMQPAIRQGSVAESDIGKTGGRDLEVLVVRHHQVLHDPLAGAHDVHGVGCFIGGDAEEVLGRIDRQQVHQLFRLDIIVLDERLDAVPVLLAAHMLMGRKVGDDVEAFLLAEDPLEDGIREVERIATELVRNIQAFRAANIAHQFGEAVLVEIDNDDAFRLEAKDCLDETGTYRTGTTDDADSLVLDLLRKLFLVCLDVRSEHAGLTTGYVGFYKLGEVEHIMIQKPYS